MRRLRNKKRLTLLLLGFLLVFISGSAFAFTPGQLDILGRVHIAPGYVIWESVTGPTFVPAGGQYLAAHTYNIQDARGRTSQRIVWEVYFQGADGFAAITATMRNQAAAPANITGITVNWIDMVGGLTPADFGMSTSHTFLGAPVTISANGTLSVTFDVEWDGKIPTTDPPIDWTGRSATHNGQTYQRVGTIEIVFDYVLAP